MADTTANLDMPFILPSQAQKHVTHNEALQRLDALVHLTITAELAAPPTSPVEGSCYLVAASPSGAWIDRQGRIAIWQDGAWDFAEPATGWRAWFKAAGRLKVSTGSSWADIPLPTQGSFDRLGIAATPDETNRLAVSSPASLFNNAGNGHQIKINKAAATDTASLLFQSNWTGYAEMGLAGDTSFSIKVSDGTNWRTGLTVNSAGRLSCPNQPAARARRSGANFSPASGSQSGFTDYDVNRGSFTLGAAVAGGGSAILVPAAGIYLLSFNLTVVTSSGHSATVLRNGSEVLLSVAGLTGGAQTQSASGMFSLNAGDTLTLGHSGTAQVDAGTGKTGLSLAMI